MAQAGERSVTALAAATVTCGSCGFAGECASRPSAAWHVVTVRCKLEIAERVRELVDTGEDREVASPDGDQVTDWLDSDGGES